MLKIVVGCLFISYLSSILVLLLPWHVGLAVYPYVLLPSGLIGLVGGTIFTYYIRQKPALVESKNLSRFSPVRFYSLVLFGLLTLSVYLIRLPFDLYAAQSNQAETYKVELIQDGDNFYEKINNKITRRISRQEYDTDEYKEGAFDLFIINSLALIHLIISRVLFFYRHSNF